MLRESFHAFRVGVWKYGFKPLAVAGFFDLLALLWTFPLQPVMAYPFILLFVAAVIGSSWFGGAIAGGMAIVPSYVLIAFFFIPPLYSIAVGKESRTYVAAYLACGFVSIVVSSPRRRSEAVFRAANEDLESRVQERTAELERSNQEILQRERQLRQSQRSFRSRYGKARSSSPWRQLYYSPRSPRSHSRSFSCPC